MPEEPPLKIGLVIERFAPGAGGVERVAWEVAHELVRQGEHVTVLARAFERDPKHGSPPEPQLAPSTDPSPGSRPGRLDPLPLPVSGTWQPLRVLHFSRRAAAATRGGAFDVVHGFARTHRQDLYRAGGGRHADYLARQHAPLARAFRRLSPRHRVLLGIERRVFRDPSQTIQCASRLVADALVEAEGVARERILLLPNGVDAARHAAPEAVEGGRILRRTFDAEDPGAERVWLLPGSGWRRKGLAPLLEAIARAEDPGLRLWVAGRDAPAPWQARARALGVADRVRFLGLRDDLPRVYHAVDGMVLPTRYDPFANVTLEAASAGLPIVTTTANGAGEWLGDGVVRLPTFAPGRSGQAAEVGALVRALADLRDEAARRRLGTRARRAAAALDWPSHVRALRDAYREIAARRREAGPR